MVGGGGEMRRVTELEEETGVHVETREIRQAEMGSGTQMLKKSVRKKNPDISAMERSEAKLWLVLSNRVIALIW